MNNIQNIAWMAGIVDGEGCFMARKINKKSLFLRFQLENTSIKMIDKFKVVLIENNIDFKIKESFWRKNSTKPIMRITINKKNSMLQFCKLILEHLTTKYNETNLIIKSLEQSCLSKYYLYKDSDFDIIEKLKMEKII